ncbi:O-antigen ligase family protein [Psychrobacter faecalis]|uniref:O-antigen ligase family protein n=1 Tax=Psychrobacter faecalis TaxID=180588 RepID=UPI0028AFA708|nr:O-antigen ligase family protein [Psychrobacter faecalis]
MSKITLYKLLIITITISPFLAFFLGSGVIAYIAPIGLMLIIFLWRPSLKPRDWLAVLLWTLFTAWAFFYYISSPYLGLYVTTYSIAIVSIPFLVFSFINLHRKMDVLEYSYFTYKIISLFCIGQLIICLGQISTYILGFGFKVNIDYGYMISGTFENSNDLAAIILLISFIYTGVESYVKSKRLLLWILIIFILIISGSRSAILVSMSIFLLTRSFNAKNLLFSFIMFYITYLIFSFFLSSFDNALFDRFSDRFLSLIEILQSGSIDTDSSSNLRLESYIFFLEKLTTLGLGSGELLNYTKYSEGAKFSTDLMFINPHSLIVEIGYWLGLPGLSFFITGLIYLLRYSNNKSLLLIALMTSSLIPASVLSNPTYFLFMIQAFFNHNNEKYNTNVS